jgi:hypothetical protein
MADPFATATELCEFTGMPIPDDLSRLQSQLQMASAIMRAHCHQTLSPVVGDVVTVYPTVSTFLSLPERPVTAVSQVLVDGVATTDYYIVPRGIRSGSVATPGSAWTRGATVTYSHGYAETTDTYALLRQMCIEMVDRAVRSPEAPSSFEPSEETIGWRSRLFLDEQQKMQLKDLKAVRIG